MSREGVTQQQVIVLTTTAHYFEYFLDWFAVFSRENTPRSWDIRLVFFESRPGELEERFLDRVPRGITISSSVLRSSSKKQFWKERLRVVSEILPAGRRTVVCDLDAFWVNAPTFVNNCVEDLVFSTSRALPATVNRLWGFNLCCGWFMVNSTQPGVLREFLDYWLRYCDDYCDDQVGLNYMLLAREIRWLRDHGDHVGKIKLNSGTLSLRALSYAKVDRLLWKRYVERYPRLRAPISHVDTGGRLQKRAIYNILKRLHDGSLGTSVALSPESHRTQTSFYDFFIGIHSSLQNTDPLFRDTSLLLGTLKDVSDPEARLEHAKRALALRGDELGLEVYFNACINAHREHAALELICAHEKRLRFTSPFVNYLKSRALSKNDKDIGDALFYAKLAAHASPNTEKYHRHHGALLLKMGQVMGSVEALVRATELNEADVDSWILLAKAYKEMGSKLDVSCLEKALKVAPNSVSIRVTLARALIKRGRIKRLKAVLEEILLLDKTNIFASRAREALVQLDDL